MHSPANFDWNDLRYFLAVAREGSSLAAARALRVNQSTVHRRLGELESRLGCPLIERHPTGYRLTEFGKDLLLDAERVEQAASALQRHAATFDKGLKGTVRLTCATAVTYRLMRLKLLDGFQQRYPGIEVKILMTERVLDLSKGEADIAIRGGNAREEALVGRKLIDLPWAIYASRAYIERHGSPKSPADINQHSIIECTAEIGDLAAARWLPSKAPRARVAGQVSNVSSLLLAVKSGLGLAPLSLPLGDNEPDLVRVFGPLPELDYPMYVFTHRDLRKIPRIAAFFGYCLNELRPALRGSEPNRRM